MTTYALDTNVCITFINGRSAALRERFSTALATGDTLSVSTVVVFELRYGAAKSQRPLTTAARVDQFLAGPIEVMELDADDAAEAGSVRAELAGAGMSIGSYDVLIAGQARRRGLTVVTGNVSEFGRVPGLAYEDWG